MNGGGGELEHRDLRFIDVAKDLGLRWMSATA
jgi:hypothetical protein